MIDITAGIEGQSGSAQADANMRSGKVLRMVRHERMGGSVPVWEKAANAKESVENTLGEASLDKTSQNFKTTLAYQGTQESKAENEDGEFTFGDLVDMVNPLHHIPVVGHLYRHFTGDEIKPISTIIGGAVFGGPVGAASSLVNTIIEKETGKNIAGNALALVLDGEAPTLIASRNRPEQQLTASIENIGSGSISELPGSVLSFADLGGGKRAVYERVRVAGGRTAGSMVSKHIEMIQDLSTRDTISQVMMEPLSLLPKDKENN